MSMSLPIDRGISVTDVSEEDKAAYLEHLQEREIYDQTMNIPYPYTKADAEWWIHHVAEETLAQGRSLNWAIRREDWYLIGGVGYHGVLMGTSHEGELG